MPRLLFALALLVTASTRANQSYETAADLAVQWLNGQQAIDGSWGSAEGGKSLATAVSVVALRASNNRNGAYYQGITWLENHGALNVDYKARRILALAAHGDDLQAELDYLAVAKSTAGNGNNGWGLSAAYDGEPLDSALALQARAAFGLGTGVQDTLDYLKAAQLTGAANQGWPLEPGGSTDAWATGQVILALLLYEAVDPTLATPIANAVATLESLVTPAASAPEKAHAALAMLRHDPASPTAAALLDALVTEQATDGSWGQDVYVTATALRVFAAALGRDDPALAASVPIADARLRTAVNTSLGKNSLDGVSLGELEGLTRLDAQGLAITDLSGLEQATALSVADLRNNGISSLAALTGLTNLTEILLEGNPLSAFEDADGDGLSDALELALGTSPLSADTDGDGVADAADDFPLDPSLSADPAKTYYVLSPNMDTAPATVVSLSDGNTVSAGNTTLNLNRNQSGVIPALDLVQGTRVFGTGPFAFGGDGEATDTPVPASFAGTAFVIPHMRSGHTYCIFSPEGDAQLQVNTGGGSMPMTALQGVVTVLDAGTNNAVAGTITADLPILVFHQATDNGDAYPVPAAALDAWGVRSASAVVGALADATGVQVYASDGTSESFVLNSGAKQAVSIGAGTAQGLGSAVHVTADGPIAVVQHDDGDGTDATAFMDSPLFGRRYGIPVDAQYLAVVCHQLDTHVTLYDGVSPPESQVCHGASTLPGKLYFGNELNGVHIGAGAYLESTKPIYVYYEAAASDDERNLIGTLSWTDSGPPPLDSDEDGIPDYADNCAIVPNGPLLPDAGGHSQRDTDGDGFGNMCDGDLNDDGSTNTLDLNLYRIVHRTTEGDPDYDPDADFNGDGAINTLDLSIYRDLHGNPPGPSCCGT
jgi:hypothetical protein